MSLILDALKRAERERRLEKAPDLTAVYEEDHLSRQGGHPWIWLSGACLIGAVVVGAAMLWSHNQGTQRSPVPGETSTMTSAPPNAAAQKEKTLPSDASPKGPAAKPAEAPALQASPAGRISDPAQGSPPAPSAPLKSGAPAMAQTPSPPRAAPSVAPKASPVQAAKAAAKPSARKPPAPKGALSAPDPAPALPTEETEDGQVLMPVAPSPNAVPVPAPAPWKTAESNPPLQPDPAEPAARSPAEPKQAADPSKAASLPLLSELPSGVREKLGKLQINVHAYSENPNERLIFINMKSLKVGDRIGENGPVLKEITPEGAVIDYGDGQVRLKVGR